MLEKEGNVSALSKGRRRRRRRRRKWKKRIKRAQHGSWTSR